MLHTIGRRPDSAPDDVVGPLLACHERIRMFSAMAERLASGAHPPEEVAEAASRVARYFRLALPLHVADEELSIRPRLIASAAPARVLEALDAMTSEHITIEELLATLLPRWSELGREPERLDALGKALASDAEELRARFDAHLEAEERIIVPAIAAGLTGAGLAIRGEMRARRADESAAG